MKKDRWTILTHIWTHFDEYVAMALIYLLGEHAGIGSVFDDAIIQRIDAGSPLPKRLSQTDWKAERIIPIGIWGNYGPFDEHDKRYRGTRISAASLAAEFFSPHVNAVYTKRIASLVEYATRIDCVGGSTKLSMAHIIKTMNWMGDEDITAAWALTGIMTYLAFGDPEEKMFDLNTIGSLMQDDAGKVWLVQAYTAIDWEKAHFEKAVQDLKGKREGIRCEKTSDGYRIVSVESDNPLMQRAVMAFLKPDIGIVRNAITGQVSIVTRSDDTRLPIDLTGVARAINSEELKARGRAQPDLFKNLSPDSQQVPGSVWSFQKGLKYPMLLNGGCSAPNVPPTQLSTELIAKIVRTALDKQYFPTLEADSYHCDGLSCVSSRKKPCPFWNYGLPRCQQIRFRKYQQQMTPSTKVCQPV